MENYLINEDGVIKQIDYTLKKYDQEYANAYNNYGELSNYISYLRYGFIVGSIGKVPNSILEIGRAHV